MSNRADLTAVVRRTIRQVQDHSSGPAVDSLFALNARLDAPLRVAVVGRVSSGKSTLVNAILGRELAATAAGECTRVSHHYTWGRWKTATVQTTDGRSVPVPMPGSGPVVTLPPGVTPDEVEYIAVTEPLPELEDLCIVDTPGLASAGSDASSHTERLLTERSLTAANSADAIVFVLTGPLRADERSAVEAYLRTWSRGGGAVAVAVLNKADKIGPDPAASWSAARRLATGMGDSHRDLFVTVLPTVGLLGQTGQVGLTEPEARAVVAIADEWDAAEAALALSDMELFASMPCGIEEGVRRGLAARLGLFGLGELVAAARDRGVRDSYGLSELAFRMSGVPALLRSLRTSITEQSAGIKALHALEKLHQIRGLDGADPVLADRLAALEHAPEMLPARLARARASVASDRLRLPAELRSDRHLVAAGAGSDPGSAERQVRMWRAWAMTATPAGREIADAVCAAWRGVSD